MVASGSAETSTFDQRPNRRALLSLVHAPGSRHLELQLSGRQRDDMCPDFGPSAEVQHLSDQQFLGLAHHLQSCVWRFKAIQSHMIRD
jgi:hypothetical protein